MQHFLSQVQTQQLTLFCMLNIIIHFKHIQLIEKEQNMINRTVNKNKYKIKLINILFFTL